MNYKLQEDHFVKVVKKVPHRWCYRYLSTKINYEDVFLANDEKEGRYEFYVSVYLSVCVSVQAI